MVNKVYQRTAQKLEKQIKRDNGYLRQTGQGVTSNKGGQKGPGLLEIQIHKRVLDLTEITRKMDGVNYSFYFTTIFSLLHIHLIFSKTG